MARGGVFALRSAPPEEHQHEEADHGEAAKREPLCVRCTGSEQTAEGHVDYIFEVLQGGVPQSGVLTPVGGRAVGTVRHRYSEFDSLKAVLTKLQGEIATLDDKFPKKCPQPALAPTPSPPCNPRARHGAEKRGAGPECARHAAQTCTATAARAPWRSGARPWSSG